MANGYAQANGICLCDGEQSKSVGWGDCAGDGDGGIQSLEGGRSIFELSGQTVRPSAVGKPYYRNLLYTFLLQQPFISRKDTRAKWHELGLDDAAGTENRAEPARLRRNDTRKIRRENIEC